MKKKALVLAGGGTKGIYQAGALQALHELGEDHFDMVIGVSVGALNAAMIVQGDIEEMNAMYENLSADQIVNGFVPNDMSLRGILREREEFVPSLQYYLKEGGIDIHPFYNMVDKYYCPERFFESSVDFGCVAALKKDHSPAYVTKDMMKEHGRDWLIASASAYPAFPVKTIDDVEYVDGGYFDNFPVDFALRQGADEVVGIDLGPVPQHPLYLGKDMIHYIHPHTELHNFLEFDKEAFARAKIIGYNDTMKVYGRYCGERYTFLPFALPDYFEAYEIGLLKLETRIKLANGINERFRSEQYITDTLKEQLHVETLSTRQYLYGVLDTLMSLLDLDETKVWSIDEASEKIMEGFADAAKEDYNYRPSLIPNDLAAFMHSLDTLTIIKGMIHANLYPDHIFMPENLVLTVYPFEKALADFMSFTIKQYNRGNYGTDC